jgi:hypothetical protein
VTFRRVADLVVVVHLAYLVFLPAGAVLVARRPRLAPLHLGAIAVAITSVTVGFDCPLTTWEQTLRRRGGQHPYPGGFVDHYLSGGAFPHGADRVGQIVVAVIVAAAYLRLARRNRTRRRTSASVPIGQQAPNSPVSHLAPAHPEDSGARRGENLTDAAGL